MKYYFKSIGAVVCALVLSFQLVGCGATQNANNKQKGAVLGAAGGAILGAIIGNNVGKKGDGGELGAVIGGVVGGAAGVIIGNKMDKNAQEIENEIPGAEVERVENGIVVTFDENSGVHFDTNKYTITEDSKVTLNKLHKVLVEYPDTNILVVGHTDSAGADSYNMTLSKNRATAVTNYFTTVKHLIPGRFTTKWYGEESPIASNDTAAGRAKNRRVNIVLVPNEKMIQDAEKEASGN